jgi:hypothetical protein
MVLTASVMMALRMVLSLTLRWMVSRTLRAPLIEAAGYRAPIDFFSAEIEDVGERIAGIFSNLDLDDFDFIARGQGCKNMCTWQRSWNDRRQDRPGLPSSSLLLPPWALLALPCAVATSCCCAAQHSFDWLLLLFGCCCSLDCCCCLLVLGKPAAQDRKRYAGQKEVRRTEEGAAVTAWHERQLVNVDCPELPSCT